MIRQECTFHEDTYNLKSYKEFLDNKLIVHSEYDSNNNKIYYETNYPNEPSYWKKLEFSKSKLIGFIDSKGYFSYHRLHGRREISIKNEFDYIRNNADLHEKLFIKVLTGFDVIFELKAVRKIGENYFYAESYVEKSKGFMLMYNSLHFEEIYYQENGHYGKKIIHVDAAKGLTEYKNLLDEFNVILCSKRYRPETRAFREFKPIY